MNVYRHMITILMSSIIIASVEAMEENRVLIKTSDGKEFWFPQWKVEGSGVLQTKQEWLEFKKKYYGALPAPITLKTIDQEKLQLFSDALDAHDFNKYLNTLSGTKKNLLLNLARPQELNSWYIMDQFLIEYGIQGLIEKYLSTTEIARYLQGLIIANNCKNKIFMQTSIEKYTKCLISNVKSNYQYDLTLYTGYYNLPPLFASVQSRFSGITNPSLVRLSNEPDKCWLIQNYTKNENKILYYFTSIDPVNNNKRYDQILIKENKKKLWAIDSETNVEIHKFIEHINPIELSVFSQDGKYLATVSFGPQGELILSDLAIKNNKFVGFDVLLTGHTGRIGPVCFNKKSTIIAAACEESVYIWDVQKKTLLQKLDCSQGTIKIISFNYNNSRFVTVSFDIGANVSTTKLWNSTYIKDMAIIGTIVWHNQCITGISFTPSGDKLIIETKTDVMILNGMSGENIMETRSINQGAYKPLSRVNAVLMPYWPMLITMTSNDNSECNVALWDIDTRRCIAPLLENQKDLVGIGLSSSGRCVYLITYSFGTIIIKLYDDFTVKVLDWIDNKANILQRYVLSRLYKAHKNNESVVLHPDSPEYRILQQFPTALCPVKEIVEKYF